MKVLRRIALVAVLIWAGYMTLFVQPTQCRDAAADSQVVPVCEPIPVMSAPVLFVAVIVGLLALPELNELEIAGLVRLKRRVAEAEAQVAEVRTQLEKWEANLAAQAVSGAAAGAQATVLVVGRDEATGLATQWLTTAPDADPTAPEELVELGEAAVMAFTAGLRGLAQAIPDLGGEVALVGFTFAEDGAGLEPTHDVFAPPRDLLERATALVNDAAPWEGALLATEPEAWIIAVRAYNVDDEPLGALAAVLIPADESLLQDDPPEDVIAAVEVAADAYARLLADLLGEQPPLAG